jgi:hypothetical protein
MRTRQGESGFALLLVFLMAAVIAITLYMEIPRVAFETQRQKEQLLIERGEQYKRAIKLFVSPRGAGRWPSKIEDLENFNNRRFLRHRFIDPMTGKDEWRLIHIQNGMLTDSAITKPKTGTGDQKQADSTAGQYVGEQAGLGQTADSQAGQSPNLALRRRPSDNMPATMYPPGGQPVGADGQSVDAQSAQGGSQAVGVGGFPGQQQYPGGVQPGVPGFPGQAMQGGLPAQPMMPGVPGSAAGMMPGQPNGATTDPNGQSYVGGGYSTGAQAANPNLPGQVQGAFGGLGNPGQAGAYPGQMSQLPAVIPGQPGTYPGASAGANAAPGYAPNADAQNAAANMIGNLLRQPRPTGAPTSTTPGGTGGMGAAIGGGIAGVASTADSDSILVYSERTNYKEWEFVYDPTKDRGPPNPLTGAGIPAAQLGNPGTPSTPGVGAPGTVQQPAGASPFGSSSQPITSFGQNSGRP